MRLIGILREKAGRHKMAKKLHPICHSWLFYAVREKMQKRTMQKADMQKE